MSSGSEAKVLATFQSWDANDDGSIDHGELQTVFKALGFSDDEVTTIFKEVDTDEDNKISYAELLSWMFGSAAYVLPARCLVEAGGKFAMPACKKKCGRPAPLILKPSGWPYDTCCRNCAKGEGHNSSCVESARDEGAPDKNLSDDPEACQMARKLFREIDVDGAGTVAPAEVDIATRVWFDRLNDWPKALRHFDPREEDLVCSPDTDCPWITYLNAFYQELGRTAFLVVCQAQAQALKAFRSQKGARILDKGLKAGDYLQMQSMEIVRSVFGDIVDREHSQEYYDRAAAKITHAATHCEYTPPSRGAITSSYWSGDMGLSEERATANITRVVRVAINNPGVKFDDQHAPLYHGLGAANFEIWKNSGPNFLAYDGKYGKGVYITPSFQMASMYAFRQPRTAVDMSGKAKPKFRPTPDGKFNYIMVYQVMARVDKIEKFTGTAFGDAADGWDRDAQIYVVREPEHAKIYGVLFCFFPLTYSE